MLSHPPSHVTPSAEETDCPRCETDLTAVSAKARTEERKAIARELHDELGQQLTALQHGLGVLRIQLGSDRPELSEQIDHLLRISYTAVDAIRDIRSSGTPLPLSNDLSASLRRLIEDFQQQSGIDCRCTLPNQSITLEPERAAHMYRIVQESLTNILRHAHASRVAVTLEHRESDYVLEIFDDGCGFTLSDTLPDSTGLSGMRERGKQLGGPVIVFSHPDQGTIVQAIFPITISI